MDSTSWDERYASLEHPWGSAPPHALMSRCAALRPGRAIDLACGDGRNTRYLAESGWEVEAVDFSPVAIEVASGADDGEDISYTVGDARAWQPAKPADLVVISFLHLPINELVAVITTAGTWLRPDGHLLYLGHALENFVYGVGGPADPAILPGIADLARASQGMRVVELAHLLRPQGDRQAVDVLLHFQPWDSDPDWTLTNGA
ncbi:MAG TPA: class I SAM-dependent methyltransferase [Mycobacterium sp.]|nr:class I SAM-dependent methyltransferase [Mycobacterium sp.]